MQARNYPVRNYTIRDGIPHMSVQAIFKDSRGLMWIGTGGGLCSYNGKSFRTWMPSDGMTASQVWSIAEDRQGNLWFGSIGEGLFRFDGKHFKQFTTQDGLVDNRIRVLHYSAKYDCIVAGSYDGVNLIRPDTIMSFKAENPINRFGAITDIADAGDFLYITAHGRAGNLRFDLKRNEIRRIEKEGMRYLDGNYGCYISSLGDTIFSATWGEDTTFHKRKKGIILYNRNKVNFVDSVGQVFNFDEDRRGQLWMASWSYHDREMEGGIFCYDGKNFRNYKKAFGIEDREIWTVYCDKEQDILWVGTINQGLFKVTFPLITHYSPGYFGLQEQKINHLFVDSKNNLWISGISELIRMDTVGNYTVMDKPAVVSAFRNFWKDTPPGAIPLLTPLGNRLLKGADSPHSEFVRKAEFDYGVVREDYENNYLIACNLGPYLYNAGNEMVAYLGPEGYLKNLEIIGDTLIVCGWEETYFNPEFRISRKGKDNRTVYKNAFFKIFLDQGQPRNVNRVRTNEGLTWFVSWTSGLWVKEGGTLTNFNQQDSTISINLTDIGFDSRGNIIFGSALGEIYVARYDGKKLGITHRIGSLNGLRGNYIRWLAVGQDDQIWVGTNEGLNLIRLNLIQENDLGGVSFFDEEEGYYGQFSKYGVIDQQGNLWIDNEDQLIRIDTRVFNAIDASPVKISLVEIEINGIFRDTIPGIASSFRGHSFEEPFRLLHRENDLIFTFDILNYRNPSKDIFRFRLYGYNNDWTQWSDRRRVSYTNLPPGSYTLQVEGYNEMNGICQQPLSIPFVINPPWWALWYVRAAVIVLLVLLMLYLIRNYVESEKRKAQVKSEIARKIALLEMQALQAQMNPHFIFNCVNGIQYYVMSNKMDEVLAYLSDFSKVVRESLENASQRLVLLGRECDFLNSYLRLEQMRFPDKFDYRIECRDGLNPDTVMIPPMLVQPFVENSVRHGFAGHDRKGSLAVIFEQSDPDLLKCTVTDNGIGRVKAGQNPRPSGSSDRPHSTSITETRLKLFNTPEHPGRFRLVYTDLYDKGTSAGLKVEIFMPVRVSKHESP